MKSVTIILAFVFLYGSVFAQKYTSQNKKAVELYEQAQQQYILMYFDKAEKLAEQAVKKDSTFAEAFSLLAGIYKAQNQLDKEIDILKACTRINGKQMPMSYFILAEEQLDNGHYEDAAVSVQTLMEHKEMLNKEELKDIGDLRFHIDSCLELLRHPVPYNPINMGDAINSANDDYLPTLTVDENEIIITSRLPIAPENRTNGNEEQEDFFISKKENGVWTKRKNLGPPINTPGNEGAETMSADGRIFYFTACMRPDGKGSCDIYYSVKQGDHWSLPKNIGSPINTANWESQPTCSADGRTLYFVSNRPGGYGQMDIWESHVNSSGHWSQPKNLGKNINTKADEQSPFLHPDGTTLYFASNGHLGMGGQDIFVSRLDTSGRWGKPVNIGYPINTFKDESDFRVNAKGTKAIISSDRPGGFGKSDLYEFDLYQKARPTEVSYVKGNIYDAKTNAKLGAKFELIEINTGDIKVQSFSDATTGQFLVPLPVNTEYALNVSKEGYLFYSNHFNVESNDTSAHKKVLNIPLHPIDKGEKMVLQNIFFDTDSFALKEASKVELAKLVEFLNQNPESKIEISGHTDNTGDKLKNIKLSENRAQSVVDYLISKGITKERLSAKGYGDSKPVVPNDTPEHKAKNRRTEFMIL